ncbi:hypothetical protein BT96DRAFT_877662 [Gymnopus androsaceus JB14]|uniref:F-box domain-containing protein n=1 Tax=Gymnopus androsaceus JB14 TaxID=1447944 RepID=A0A6A4I1V0_9AGAR|nr:hypothetical protein BT96DRAFT_877662 [Gymnopus androsaceus JB14]
MPNSVVYSRVSSFFQNQRKRLEDYKSCLRFLRSPIRRLPNETVLRIFDFACDMNDLTSKKLQTMPALVISGVCSRWRNLARSCPELWSRIQITIWSTPRRLPSFPVLDLYLRSSTTSSRSPSNFPWTRDFLKPL